MSKLFKNNMIKSLFIVLVGVLLIFIARKLISNADAERIAYPPNTHDVDMSDDQTTFVDSNGEYELWIRAYSLGGIEILNVNYYSDERRMGDAVMDDLNTLDSFEFYLSGSANVGYGRSVKTIMGYDSNLGGSSGTYFNSTSSTHNACVGGESIATDNPNTCQLGIDSIQLDYQNVFIYYLSNY